jgi:hypothetical protein
MDDFIRITVEGQEAFFAALAGLDARVSDLRPSWPKVDAVYVRGVREQFGSEGGRTGGWAALSEAYAREKAKTYPGKPIEQASGRLFASLTDKDAEGAIYDEQPDSFTRGSSLPYALKQHETRDLFGFRDEDGGEILAIIADDLTAYAKELGVRA